MRLLRGLWGSRFGREVVQESDEQPSVLSMGVAPSLGCGSENHETGRTRQSGVGSGEDLSGCWPFPPPDPRQEPVTSLSCLSPQSSTLPYTAFSPTSKPSSVSMPFSHRGVGGTEEGLRDWEDVSRPRLQVGIGLANQKAPCDRLLMSVWRGVMSLGHMLSLIDSSPRYTVMSGTPEKILELLLEAMRPDSSAHDPTGSVRRHSPSSLSHREVTLA